jgi:RimJ/RimL family protein N-acetyltransferase
MPILSSARLILRPPAGADAQALMEIHQDPVALPHVMVVAPVGGITVAWRNIAMMLGHWQLRGYGQWTVVERATEDVIGRVGFFNPEGWPGIELGWIIGRSRWGQGFATEATRACLTWGADNLEADHVTSLINPANPQSARIAIKIGGQFERDVPMGDEVFRLYKIGLR